MYLGVQPFLYDHNTRPGDDSIPANNLYEAKGSFHRRSTVIVCPVEHDGWGGEVRWASEVKIGQNFYSDID